MRALGLAVLLLAGLATPGVCAGYDELNAGIAARNLKDWDGAITHFSSALAAGDLIPDQQYVAHLDRAEAHLSKGERDAAIADYSACVGLRAGDAAALLFRAALYAEAGNSEAAGQDFDAALALDPRSPVTLEARANYYEIEGKPEKELADLQAIQANQSLDSQNKTINLEIGIAKLQMGRTDEAAAIFEQSPGNPGYAWLWLAMAKIKQGKGLPAGGSTLLRTPPWPDPIVQFYLGKSTEEALLAKAASAPQVFQQGAVCDANFYVGEWRLLHADTPGATLLFRKAAADCPRGYIERYATLAEPKNGH